VPVDQALIVEACEALGVVEMGALKDGAQKTVRLVDRDSERLVLKVMQVGTTTPQALLRAAREVDLLGKLDNDNVVRVASDLVELGSAPEGAAWLEEYLDGEDLADCATPAWSWQDAREMGCQLGRGLGAMHDIRVVHRDLSPNNIRRTSTGVFKVMDPGYARHELLAPLTVGGHPGTPGYMSPEHLNVPPAGPTAFSDVFCLGGLMWLVLSGSSAVPYLGDMSDYAARLQTASLHDQAGMRSMLSAEQFAFLQRCLHRQPARRFKNGAELAQALEGIA
jgi:serine/threonine protein kinase